MGISKRWLCSIAALSFAGLAGSVAWHYWPLTYTESAWMEKAKASHVSSSIDKKYGPTFQTCVVRTFHGQSFEFDTWGGNALRGEVLLVRNESSSSKYCAVDPAQAFQSSAEQLDTELAHAFRASGDNNERSALADKIRNLKLRPGSVADIVTAMEYARQLYNLVVDDKDGFVQPGYDPKKILTVASDLYEQMHVNQNLQRLEKLEIDGILADAADLFIAQAPEVAVTQLCKEGDRLYASVDVSSSPVTFEYWGGCKPVSSGPGRGTTMITPAFSM